MDYIILLLSQFGGGPGPEENNLVRFGLAAILFAVLFFIAWSRQRNLDLPREKLLVWGFGLGFLREFYMFVRTSTRIITETEHDALCTYTEPLEHGLALAAMVVIAGSFLRYILDQPRVSRQYLRLGIGVTVVAYLSTFLWWAQYLAANPTVKFHQTWSAWVFHGAAILLMALALVLLRRGKGWLRNVVMLALLFFLLAEAGTLVNYGTDRVYRHTLCPIDNTLHILAIPILGYVYLREQAQERQEAEDKLRAYRDQLEELVEARTAELAQLSQQNELILNSAGEGLFGVDLEGRHTFINPAGARMLGYAVEDLIGLPSHATWHHSRPDGSPYPVDECPLHAGYKAGVPLSGDDQVFWRRDGSSFPVAYTSTPAMDDGELAGAVVVFRDITERKQAEVELARRNAELAGQNEIADTLSQSLDLDTILGTALERVLSLLEVDAGSIYLLDPDGEMMTLQASEGVSAESEGVARQLRMTEGVSGLAMSANRPVVLDAADYVRESPHEFQSDAFQTVISTPLVSKGWVIGALTLGSRDRRSIPQQIMNLLASIGQQVGMAVENAHLYQQTERLASGLARLHQAGVLLGSSLDTVTIYEHITEQGAILLNCQVARLYLWDAEEGEAREISSYGLDGSDVAGSRLIPEENDVLADLIDHRRPVVIKNYGTDPRASRYYGQKLNIKAELALPLMVHERLLGFLFLIDQHEPRLWLTEEIDWAESLVNQASFALENATLYEKAERAAALEERQRIAADIHDGLAQTVGYLGLKADQVAELVAAGKADVAVDELQRMRDAIGQASQEVRQSIASLQQSPYSHRPLESWLGDVITEFSQSSDAEIHWINRFDDPLLLPPSHVEQVLRVVQEALLNAGRHAEASEIMVILEEKEGQVLVTIEDDGVGFDPTVAAEDSRMRFGLSIMRARAARLQGDVEVFSEPGKGTRVLLSWPRTSSTFTMARPK